MFNFFGNHSAKQNDPFCGKLADYGKTFDDFKESDVAIKIWLPEPAEEKLRELCGYFAVSRPAFLRSIYFVYLYGRYDFEQMRSKSLGLFCASDADVMFSRLQVPVTHRSGTSTTPELGKNAEDFKLWLPSKMKVDLQRLANRAETPLSQFLREVLVSALFGHGYLAERTALTRSAGTEADIDSKE